MGFLNRFGINDYTAELGYTERFQQGSVQSVFAGVDAQQIDGIEGELQSARRYYNATVRDLNSTIQSFPPVVIARPLGFTEEPFYQDEDPAIQSAPKVSFARPAA